MTLPGLEIINVSVSAALIGAVIYFLRMYFANTQEELKNLSARLDQNMETIRSEVVSMRSSINGTVDKLNTSSLEAYKNMTNAKIATDEIKQTAQGLNDIVTTVVKPALKDVGGKIIIVEKATQKNRDDLKKIVTIMQAVMKNKKQS